MDVGEVRRLAEEADEVDVLSRRRSGAGQADRGRASIINRGSMSMIRTTADGRPGQPEDIAYAALFLASDEARYINGET